MQTVRQSGYQKHRERGQGRTEAMAMECILCFAVMKKLGTGAPGGKLPAARWVGGRILHEEGEGR